MLTDHSFRALYNSNENDILDEFYIPALSNATKYDRISAYFDSKILRMYAAGLENIIKSDGHVRFIFSSEITAQDYDEMKRGYKLREELEKKIIRFIW